MDIAKMSDTELKALAYDLIEQRESVQANLNIVNQELLRRRQEASTKDETQEKRKAVK